MSKLMRMVLRVTKKANEGERIGDDFGAAADTAKAVYVIRSEGKEGESSS